MNSIAICQATAKRAWRARSSLALFDRPERVRFWLEERHYPRQRDDFTSDFSKGVKRCFKIIFSSFWRTADVVYAGGRAPRRLEARPVTGLLAEGVGYHYWTYNGTVPGPMIRVRQGDTVELTLHNALDSPVSHSIDSHAVLGPGGGGKVTQTPPGATSVFQFKAMKPGVFIYHCATPTIPYHLSHGMYGLMVVEPPGGLSKVDKEFYVMQGDIYLKGDPAQSGVHEAAVDKMEKETPDFVVFNGSVESLAKSVR